MSPTYRYPRPALTVDLVAMRYYEGALETLLIRRANAPFKGRWALPGGFVEIDEELDAAARREFREETGLKAGGVEQLGTYGGIGRDPRGRTVSVVFVALLPPRGERPRAADDAAEAAWHALASPPELAFDHERILKDTRRWLAEAIRRRPIVFDLLPARFTLEPLHRLCEALASHPVNRDGLRRRLLGRQIIVPAGRSDPAAAGGHPTYRFDAKVYRRFERNGWRWSL